jgi:methyl-accepting chemotaxis protein
VDHVRSRPCSEEPVLKLAFVKHFASWGWVIGTGSPIDDNEARFRADAFALLQLGLAIGGFIAACLLLLSRHILHTLGGEPFAEESLRTAVLQSGITIRQHSRVSSRALVLPRQPAADVQPPS